MNYQNGIYRALFHNCVQYKKNTYFWDINYNGLFECKEDNITHRIPLKCYSSYNLLANALYSKVILWKNILIGVPLVANEVLLYNIETFEEEYISISDYGWSDTALIKGKMWDAVIDGNNVFLIGYWSSLILKVDIIQQNVVDVLDVYEGKEKPDNEVFYKKAYIVKENLYVPACVENCVFVINTESLSFRIESFDKMKKGFSDILIEDDNIWLLPRFEDPIVCWKLGTRDKVYLNVFPKDFSFGKKPGLGFMRKIGNSILCIPFMASDALMIDIDSLKIDKIELINSNIRQLQENSCYINLQKYYYAEVNENRLYLLNGITKKIEIYDMVTQTVDAFCIEILAKDRYLIYKQFLESSRDGRYILSENKIMLSDFIQLMLTEECNKKKTQEDNMVGEMIYAKIKELL